MKVIKWAEISIKGEGIFFKEERFSRVFLKRKQKVFGGQKRGIFRKDFKKGKRKKLFHFEEKDFWGRCLKNKRFSLQYWEGLLLLFLFFFRLLSSVNTQLQQPVSDSRYKSRLLLNKVIILNSTMKFIYFSVRRLDRIFFSFISSPVYQSDFLFIC